MKMDSSDKLLSTLKIVIHSAVRLLSILIVFVIVMGVIDVGWMIYTRMNAEPKYVFTISDMLATFGAFMAVLIAIEIFVNITIYLREDIIHVKIVMATALMAIARKVIIMDIDNIDPLYMFAVASVVLAMSIGYWLVHKLSSQECSENCADNCPVSLGDNPQLK